jgi:hypothetical protein
VKVGRYTSQKTYLLGPMSSSLERLILIFLIT